MRTLLASILLSVSFLSPLFGQKDTSNSVRTSDTDTLTQKEDHSPRKATVRSAIIPGWGQAYNRKYWKIPVIYAGIGASAYFIVRNTRQYNKFKEAYIARVDEDPNTVDDYQGIYSADQLRTIQDTYRRWRDLSYISLGAVYVLNILDASVDAHLYDFDVSDDLSLRVEPDHSFTGAQPHTGIRILMKF